MSKHLFTTNIIVKFFKNSTKCKIPPFLQGLFRHLIGSVLTICSHAAYPLTPLRLVRWTLSAGRYIYTTWITKCYSICIVY